ncbi:hypothetical protein V8C86DRAFT_1300180 [Haematococcus lacustris]
MYDMSARLVTSFLVFIGLAAAQAAPSVQGLPSINSIAVTACSLCAPGLLQPVCGADGVTYATECHLACEGVALTALGPCVQGQSTPLNSKERADRATELSSRHSLLTQGASALYSTLLRADTGHASNGRAAGSAPTCSSLPTDQTCSRRAPPRDIQSSHALSSLSTQTTTSQSTTTAHAPGQHLDSTSNEGGSTSDGSGSTSDSSSVGCSSEGVRSGSSGNEGRAGSPVWPHTLSLQSLRVTRDGRLHSMQLLPLLSPKPEAPHPPLPDVGPAPGSTPGPAGSILPVSQSSQELATQSVSPSSNSSGPAAALQEAHPPASPCPSIGEAEAAPCTGTNSTPPCAASQLSLPCSPTPTAAAGSAAGGGRRAVGEQGAEQCDC